MCVIIDLLSMGSWKVTCVAAVADDVAVTTGLEVLLLLRCSAGPLPSGGKLLRSDMELPYTGSLSAGRMVTVLVPPGDCWGCGPPSTGDRCFVPTPPRGADGNFC